MVINSCLLVISVSLLLLVVQVESFHTTLLLLTSTNFRQSQKKKLHKCAMSHRTMTQCRRVSIAGVSVSPSGFWALLGIPNGGYWPLQITTSPDDEKCATTPEALTVLQLIAGIDMAGAILPPDVLAKLVVLHAEEERQSLHSKQVTALVEPFLPESVASYSETNDWQRSRVQLPQVTLDELTLNPLRLDVSVKGLGPFSFTPSSASIEAVCYGDSFDPNSSTDFVSLSLALRYKAPIIMRGTPPPPTNTMTCITDHFPDYSTVERLHVMSSSNNKVTKNIETGFEIHNLSGALRMAMERGDVIAEEKIRAKLQELESMDDSPTE